MRFSFLFILKFYSMPIANLSGRGLEVVLVEVALEIEVGQLLTLRHAEELLERGIRLDVVLVLEALLLHVGIDGLGDLRARHLRALGLTEEVAELIGNLGGALEDGRGTLDLVTVLINLRLALALASILNLTMDTLLEALDLAEQSSDSLAHRGEVASHGLDVLIERGRRGRNRGGLSGGRRDRGNDDRGRHRRSDLSLGGLGGLLGRRRRGRRSNNGGRGGLNGDLLLRDLLSDLGSSRSVHHTGTRGILHRIFPHYLLPGDLCVSIFGQGR
jgi:hypothetical protein